MFSHRGLTIINYQGIPIIVSGATQLLSFISFNLQVLNATERNKDLESIRCSNSLWAQKVLLMKELIKLGIMKLL